MSIRYTSLAVFGVAVVGFAVYLFVEVRSSPARAQAPDHASPATAEPPARTSTPSPTFTPAPAEPPHLTSTVKVDAARSHANAIAASPGRIIGHLQPTGSDDPERATPKLDSLMSEANKAYDRGDIDDARSDAERALAQSPNNTRMLRILVSVACLDGDQAAAQKSYDLLPAPDRGQMKTRCERSGVTFSDSVPPP